MKKETNIISLIGMTGCGKTSVGKILAKKLGAEFIDL
ncbi:MAG: AAA family ATPase, partial [Clostridiales bacterium]|nr:AAA family ATPase [Clostridiales bacterium]